MNEPGVNMYKHVLDLCVIINSGQGVKKNSRVVKWNRKATEQGHVYIILTVGLKNSSSEEAQINSLFQEIPSSKLY